MMNAAITSENIFALRFKLGLLFNNSFFEKSEVLERSLTITQKIRTTTIK
jgi:hypothetical protein